MSKGRTICFALLLGSVAVHGCHWASKKQAFRASKDSFNPCCPETTEPSPGPNQLDLTDASLKIDCSDSIQPGVNPLYIDFTSLTPDQTLNLSLQQCVQLSLENSRIMRDLGGAVVRTPQGTVSRHDPGLAFTDPRFGEQAALAEFDATLEASALIEKNDAAQQQILRKPRHLPARPSQLFICNPKTVSSRRVNDCPNSHDLRCEQSTIERHRRFVV